MPFFFKMLRSRAELFVVSEGGRGEKVENWHLHSQRPRRDDRWLPALVSPGLWGLEWGQQPGGLSRTPELRL